MKWLVFLFSLYLLVLSGIPCNADDDCCMDEARITANADGDNKGEADDHHAKAPCSPLFACCACHGVTLPAMVLVLAPYNTPVSALHLSFYQAYIPAAYPSLIWQPPRHS